MFVCPVWPLLRYDFPLDMRQPMFDRRKDSVDVRVHADPLAARPAMAIDAAVYVGSLDADVVRVDAAVSPPFRRAEKADDRRSGGDGNVRRARVAADVDG